MKRENILGLYHSEEWERLVKIFDQNYREEPSPVQHVYFTALAYTNIDRLLAIYLKAQLYDPISIISAPILAMSMRERGEYSIASSIMKKAIRTNWSYSETVAALCAVESQIGVKYSPIKLECSTGVTYCTDLGTFGRLGHQLADHFLLNLICSQIELTLATRICIPVVLFKNTHYYSFKLNTDYQHLTEKEFCSILDLTKESARKRVEGVNVSSLSPSLQSIWSPFTRKIFRQNYQLRDEIKFYFYRYLSDLTGGATRVGAIHIRKGDRSSYYQLGSNEILELLSRERKKFDLEYIYLCTDDQGLAYELAESAGWILTSGNTRMEPALCTLFDFYVLTQARILWICQSGFSVKAAYLNYNAETIMIYEQNSQAYRIFCADMESNDGVSLQADKHTDL